MISNFDFFGRYERPELILCNPDDSEIGIIANAKELQTNLCLSDISDISYKIYKTDNPAYNSEIYEKHIERRQVRVVGLGYFIITSCDEYEDENGKYKQISAKSCEYELNNIAMPYINGTYKLYKPENFEGKSNEEIAQQDDEYLNENCILYEIMKIIPTWTLDGQTELIGAGIKHSDEMRAKYKELADTFRTFEYSDMTVYSFLVNELQDSYKCFVYFDIENRKINILHQEDVFEVLPMTISKANILDSCSVSTTIDNYVNTLNVEGTSGVSISSINPLGNSMIYNFDHDINTGLIDGELKTLIEYWKKSIKKSDVYDGDCYPSVMVQKWLSAPSKLNEYKYKLLDEIGKGENGNINSILDSESYLKDVGLSELEATEFKTELKKAIDDAFAAAGEGDSDFNTAEIENLFFKIGRYRINILIPENSSSSMDVIELNKFLYSAQELQMGVESELDLLDSYKSGYDAQYEALKVTVTDGSEESESIKTQQLELVDGYRNLVEASKTGYSDILKSVTHIIEDINNILSNIYHYNSFETSFKRYFIDTLGYNDESAKEFAFKAYASLTRYIKQQTYNDDTIIITDAMGIEEKFTQESELFNSSKNLLEKISMPGYEMNISAESFLFSKEYENIIDQLSIRSAVYVEIPSGDVPLFHLLKISITYDEPSCEFIFGNRIRLSDPTTVFSDLQRTATSAANIVATERIEWGVSEEKINELMSLKNADIDTTFRMMSNSVNKTTMGNDGFKCYAVDDKGNQSYGMWCANGVMMFLDVDKDSGETKPQMAIGRMLKTILKSDGTTEYSTEYGFYGHSIIANTITVDKLVAGALSKGTNHIRNGSFESSVKFWDVPEGALLGDSLKNAHLCPTGSNCVYLISGKSISQNISYSSAPITKGTYVLSFYYRKNTTSPENEFDDIRNLKISIINEETGEEVEHCLFTDNQTVTEINDSNKTSAWARCYKRIELPTMPNVSVKICNDSAWSICIDGVMLEKSSDVNEYTPHISETYAKYTTIDDSGITVYNGKIKILNNVGTSVFNADDDGNLVISGKLTANSGSNIAGWETNDYAIYKDNTGLMSSGAYAFFAGADGYNNDDENGRFVPKNPSFGVTHDGHLVASKANITGDIYASYLEATTGGKIANWTISDSALSGGKLVLTTGKYITEFDGRSLRFGTVNSSGIYSEADFGSCISMMKSTNNVFNDPTSDNLSIAGRTVIQFGLRGDTGSFEEVGRMYKFSYTGSSNRFNKNVLDINSIKLSNVIINGVVYSVSAGEAVTRIGSLTGHAYTETFLKLDAFSGTLGNLFDWVFG